MKLLKLKLQVQMDKKAKLKLMISNLVTTFNFKWEDLI